MKTILPALVLSLLFAPIHSGRGQTDTNALAVGQWSETIRNANGCALRGRLLVYPAPKPGYVSVYVELQHVFLGAWAFPIEIDFGPKSGLNLDLHDALGHFFPERMIRSIRGPVPWSFRLAIPCDATIRLHADDQVLGAPWLLPSNPTNGVFLSGSFTSPPTNTNEWHDAAGSYVGPIINLPRGASPSDHPTAQNANFWRGKITFPKVEIPVQRR